MYNLQPIIIIIIIITEIADGLAKEATQKCQVIYSRIPKCTLEKDNRKESIRNGNVKGRKQRNERLLKIFSKRRRKTGSESKLKSKCNCNFDRPWKYSILLTSIKSYRKSRVPMQTWHTNGRPSNIPVRKASG